MFANTSRQAAHAASGDVPTMFLGGNARTGYNGAETMINATTASQLKVQAMYHTGGTINAQPVVANGQVYWGSWDGNEYATDLTGRKLWSDAIGGQTPNCNPPDIYGVGSSAAVANVTINGANTSVVFVGGKNVKSKAASLYALNAATGAVIWETPLTTTPDSMTWSSPALYNGSVYIGLSSVDDCPLLQAGLFELNAATGAIEHSFDTVPNGCIGASIWASPAINDATGMIFVATGNNGPCSVNEPYGQAIVELNAADLSYVDSWQVPPSTYKTDSDFGATPTLFSATIGGVGHQMLGVVNKNGFYYALDQSSLHSGPVWSVHISASTKSIASSAWDGTTLYVAGRNTTIKGQNCAGNIQALNPATGAAIWRDCLNTGFVLAPVSAVPGVAFVGAGADLIAVATGTGAILFDYKTSNYIYGAASVSNGAVYVGNNDGTLYFFGLPSTGTPTPTPTPSPTVSPTPSPTGTPTPLPPGPVSHIWYFAEGKVGQGFTEYVTIENPDPVNRCSVTLEYLLASGNPVTKSVTVNPNSRWTEYVNGDLNTAPSSATSQTVSTIVKAAPGACKGVVAERPMYVSNFGGVSSGSDALGATHTARSFSFADVSTAPGYATYITILNPPGGVVATVTATYSLGGVQLGTQTLTLQPGTRGTIFPTHFGKGVAAVVTSDHPVVVERPTYFSSVTEGNAGVVSGAASVVGAEHLSNDWLFAEGYTGPGFQEKLVLANTGATDISGGSLKLEYDNGTTISFPVAIGHRDQTTFDINQLTADPALGTCVTSPRCATTANVSLEVSTPAGTGFVAEREMFFRYNNHIGLTATGGTDLTGHAGPATAKAYSFAEGYTNAGYNEWLTLQNPTTGPETINVTLVNGLGRASTTAFVVGAQSRFTVDITGLVTHNLVQAGDGYQAYEVSMTVRSTAGAFVAERPMYWNASGTQGGSSILGYIGG